MDINSDIQRGFLASTSGDWLACLRSDKIRFDNNFYHGTRRPPNIARRTIRGRNQRQIRQEAFTHIYIFIPSYFDDNFLNNYHHRSKQYLDHHGFCIVDGISLDHT